MRKTVAVLGALIELGACAPQPPAPRAAADEPRPPASAVVAPVADALPISPAPIATTARIRPAYVVLPLASGRSCARIGYLESPADPQSFALALDDGANVRLAYHRHGPERLEVVGAMVASASGPITLVECRSTVEIVETRLVIEGVDLFATREECEKSLLVAASLDHHPRSPDGVVTCWPRLHRLITEERNRPRGPAPLTSREAAFLTFVAGGLTIYEPNDCKPWRVVPTTRHGGNIERREHREGAVLVRRLSYAFHKRHYEFYIEYSSSSVVTLTPAGTAISAEPSLGRQPVDPTAADPVGGIAGWHPTLESCLQAVDLP